MKIYHGTNVEFGVAFCTEESLDALLDYNEPARYKIEEIIAELSVKLMQDRNISKIDAMTIVYNSTLFTQLVDENSGLYLKPWQDIYDLLKIGIPTLVIMFFLLRAERHYR